MRVAVIAFLFTGQSVPPMAQPLWEKIATFGVLGLICAWLFIERWLTAAKDREARHALANSMQENTLATGLLATKIEDLSRAIWQFVLSGGGQRGSGGRDAHQR